MNSWRALLISSTSAALPPFNSTYTEMAKLGIFGYETNCFFTRWSDVLFIYLKEHLFKNSQLACAAQQPLLTIGLNIL